MGRTRDKFNYASFNLAGIHDSIIEDRKAYAKAVNEEIAEKGQADALPHLARLWVDMKYQEQQTQLAIASELRQLNTLIEHQYMFQTRHTRRWEAFCDDVAAGWKNLLAWRPRLPGRTTAIPNSL